MNTNLLSLDKIKIVPIYYDRLILKTITIWLPFSRGGLTALLSPLLGQYGIRNTEFLTAVADLFNAYTLNQLKGEFLESSMIEENGLSTLDILVPVQLNIYKGGKFNISITLPPISFLAKMYYSKKDRRLRRKGELYRNIKKSWQITLCSFNTLFSAPYQANYSYTTDRDTAGETCRSFENQPGVNNFKKYVCVTYRNICNSLRPHR